jgi:hypothetical protein
MCKCAGMTLGGEWSSSRCGRFNTRDRGLSNHWIGGWVGSRVVLDSIQKTKISFPRRDPVIQPVAQSLHRLEWLSLTTSSGSYKRVSDYDVTFDVECEQAVRETDCAVIRIWLMSGCTERVGPHQRYTAEGQSDIKERISLLELRSTRKTRVLPLLIWLFIWKYWETLKKVSRFSRQ